MGWRDWLPWTRTRPRVIPDELWAGVMATHSYLLGLSETERLLLRSRASEFLAHKEFSGAQGLQVSDAMAVTIAAQAVLPVLHLGLGWYDDFVGIVVHPDEVLAARAWTDEAGVVHEYEEALAGESLDGGPVMLSWKDVDEAARSTGEGYNVVIHEFVHKLDQRDGRADGCPPLPDRAARARWQATLQAAFERFTETLTVAERFGGQAPWLDPYAATDLAEFFATSAEAYFVNRPRFSAEFPELVPMYDGFFRASKPARP